MQRTMLFALLLALTLGAAAQNEGANAKLQADLFAKEKALWDGWMKKDTKIFEELLAQDGVYADAFGFQDRAGTLKMISSHNCKVKSFSFSDQKLTRIDDDAAIISFKAIQDGECDGQKIPPVSFVTSTWAKQKGKWVVFGHSETPAMPPPAPTAK